MPTPLTSPRATRHSTLACLLVASLVATLQARPAADEKAVTTPTPAAPAAPALSLQPISAGLGLADITAAGVAGPARLTLTPASALHHNQSVTLLWSNPAAQPVRRVMLGPGTGPLLATLQTRAADGTWSTVVQTTLPAIAPPPNRASPDWAKGAVWYQVFPERFANANPANDPKPRISPGEGVYAKAWNSDWNAVELGELEAVRAEAAARTPYAAALAPSGQRAVHNSVVFRRRYGGDLQGLAQRLDHLKDLGVTALYLTPVFRAPSLHKYDTADYRHIDDHFASLAGPALNPDGGIRWHEPTESDDPTTWTWTPADLYVRDTLIPAVKSKGFRIIFDGVWNHTGRDFHAFSDLLARGSASPYADWYDAQFAPPLDERDPAIAASIAHIPPGALMTWKGWDARNGRLPAFKQVPVAPDQRVPLEMTGRPEIGIPTPKQTDLAPGPKKHIFDITRRWMDPYADGSLCSGIDGWRLDVAADIGLPFWRDWHAHVKSINPEAMLIAEIWHPAWDYFRGNGFDAQMNYPFARAAVAFLQLKPSIDATKLGQRLDAVFCNDPATDLVQMNVLTSHDTDRLASCLFNSPADYDSSGQLSATSTYNTQKPSALAYQRVALAIALQATYVGAPMIYNGEEFGMHGADDPHSRKPIPWPDLPAPQNPADAAMPEMRETFSRWFHLRQDPVVGPVLRYGSVRHFTVGSDVFGFDRRLNDRVVRVAINRGDRVTLDLPAGATTVLASNPSASSGAIDANAASVWTWVDAE